MSEEDNEMQRLFDAAPVRPQPSAELIERAKAAARPEWQAAVARASDQQISQRLPLQKWAMAAALAFATVLLGWQLLLPTQFEIQVVRAEGLRLNNEALATGVTHLQVGDEFHTQSLAELSIPGSDSESKLGGARNSVDIRLAANTRARWLSANRLQLISGGVYVDTHGTARFGVTTRAGKIDDIGTRYIATLQGDVLEVAVSAGAIELTTVSQQVRATPANSASAAVLRVASSSIERSDEPAESPRWQWAMEHTQEYRGQLLAQALEAIAQRLGKTLEFHNSGDAAEARSYVVQGETGGLSASDALDVIAATNNLEVTYNAKTIRVSFGRR